MMKKLKLKRNAVKFLILVPCLILVVWYSLVMSINIYNKRLIKENYETELVNHGYTLDEAKELINIFDNDKLDMVLVYNVNSDIINLAKEKYFIFNNLERYLNYLNNNNNLSLKEIVALVNVNRDYEEYNYDLESDTSLHSKILVNKYYKLNESYVPEDLITINSEYADSIKITKEAYLAFDKMWNEMNKKGLNLKIISGYQSYLDQEKLYKENIEINKTETLKKIAQAGYAESQTGLSIKLSTLDDNLEFKDTEEYKWLKDNAYLYGFIERYPKNKENITGFKEDASYFRYVGKKIAQAIYKEKITFDEYYAYYIEKTKLNS